jgi:hypothetical protein
VVQAENYDTGGPGVGYRVNAVNGSANGYRPDGVDLENTTDTGGGYNVGWTAPGQWFRYTVNVASAGSYTLRLRVAAPSAVTGALHLADTSGTNLTGILSIPATGGWQSWTTITAGLVLPAGQQVLTLVQDTGGWNINSLQFTGDGAPVVSLRAHANGKYVTAENAGAQPLIANRAAIGSWEQFDLIDQGNGMVALRAHANGKYVTAEDAGAKPLIANRAAIGAWEKFTLIHNPDGSVSLRSQANNQYVTAENAGAQPLIANRAAIGAWEEFDLITG